MRKPESGTARTWTPQSTHLTLSGTTNLRDLGGTPAAEGQVVAPGRLYRAEALVRPGASALCAVWDESQADAYAALGVRTVLDLRSGREQRGVPSAWPVATGAEYVAIPIDEGGEGDTDYVRQIREGRRARFTLADMAEYYGLTLRRRHTEFAAALRVIARADQLPVLVHCAAGKDRTGLLIALLLEVLGTPRETVVAEYALTGVLRPNRVADYADLLADSGVALDAVAVLFDAPAGAMAATLAELDAEFGSVVSYLERRCGLVRPELEALRANLLVSSWSAPS